ncbi:unnamed protein product [Arctia plantaginis]|uniref:Flavin-containing monooxygenase n=1 Tax=Arctia plantaginis TaxID=874455 RepID=A0A8S1AB15_ARCPL|nr:unnamed protein product [Arctia plantaginis]
MQPSVATIIVALNIYLQVSNALSESTPASQVCIIGAGYSGLATARYMKDYGLNFKVFEGTSFIGGTWRFDPRTETDEFGMPLFTNQYKNLRTNAPTQVMEFNGYPFPEGSVSYASGSCFYKYLLSFARHFDLVKNVQFRSHVKWVEWMGKSWNLTYLKTDTNETVTEKCAFVVVASGEYNNPYIPHFEGQELYKGKVMHSHAYKDVEDYRGQRVLVIGGGPSGIDLGTQLANVTSKLVHSHHILKNFQTFNPPNFPKAYINKPDLKHFTPNGAVFEDDTFEDVDIVIYCTGYKYHLPFLNHLSSGITATENYVLPLYQQVVNINQPTMTFVGVSKTTFARILDVQAEYSAALAAGRFNLPSQDKMLRHWLEHAHMLRQEGFKITDVNSVGHDELEYFEDLHKEAGIQRVPFVFKALTQFNIKNALEDLLHFRDYDYKIVSDTQYERRHNPRKEECPFDV